jgi:hypothetical protein
VIRHSSSSLVRAGGLCRMGRGFGDGRSKKACERRRRAQRSRADASNSRAVVLVVPVALDELTYRWW